MRRYLRIIAIVSLLIGAYFVYNAFFKQHPSIDFYHWKQSYSVPKDALLKPHYIKCIDIGYNGRDVEYRDTIFKTASNSRIVPVIYIDNRVLSHVDAGQLAQNIYQNIEKLSQSAHFTYEKIEVDCDWTPSSREKYFAMLKELKAASKKKIEVTIRLHQIKYASKTGVPPADSGMLMYYNMSDFTSIDTKNYILDIDVAKRYHYNFDTYPLALDLALPLYTQATIIRFSKVVGAIEGVNKDEIIKENFKHLSDNLYQVTKEHYLKGKLLYEGDRVRFDSVSIPMLQEAIDTLKSIMKRPNKIVFFRWGNFESGEKKSLEDLAKSF